MSPRNGRGRYVRQAPDENFGQPDRGGQTVGVDVGHGQIVPVAVGNDFVDTVEQLARNANYGGYYKVFLNGHEIVDPAESPTQIAADQRIAITSYDKVGTWKAA